jgi:hypothetical protein
MLYTLIKLICPLGARSIWIVLSLGRLAAKTPIDRYLIFLDFLGFPRPNRDLSMGYTRLSRKKFSSRFSPAFEARGRNPTVLTRAEAQDCSLAKLNLTSAYPQELVGSSRLTLPGAERDDLGHDDQSRLVHRFR